MTERNNLLLPCPICKKYPIVCQNSDKTFSVFCHLETRAADTPDEAMEIWCMEIKNFDIDRYLKKKEKQETDAFYAFVRDLPIIPKY